MGEITSIISDTNARKMASARFQEEATWAILCQMLDKLNKIER